MYNTYTPPFLYSFEATQHLVIQISMNSFGSLNTWTSNSIWLCKIKVLKLVQAYEKGRTKQDIPYVSFEETQDNNIKNL